MKKTMLAAITMLMTVLALAKLPPLSDEANAKAEEAKARTAWSNKAAAYQLCLAQDKVAAIYRKAKSREARPAATTPAVPPCQDPGPYAAQPRTVSKVSAADPRRGHT